MLVDARGVGEFVEVEMVRVGGTRENLFNDESCAGTTSSKCGQVL